MNGAAVTIWRNGVALFPRARVVRTPLSKLLGMLHRREIGPDEALIFPRCRSLHTFFMRFAIDIAFLGRSGEVVRLFSSVGSGRCLFGGPEAAAALECGEKILASHEVELGQRLTWSES